ncbi:hypothetical protein GCM10009733_103340 [Nonomuraea maheshkhaliensis]|uniref:Helix-turn-helix domain-containing protein n=1 Tax=Nonomuraea maheshkhaliensis TaxID=419590 RepID=A0ABN2HMU5_9ACTN
MHIVADERALERFARLPETFIWSGMISHNGICVLAVLHSRLYLGNPVRFTIDELVTLSGLSARTVKRAVSELREIGLIEVTKTRGGNAYQLFVGEIPGDTYRGRDSAKVSRTAYAQVFMWMTASSVSSAALRLWLMLDRIGRGHHDRPVFSSQKTLAGYMGVKERQIRNLLKELENAGIQVSERPDPMGGNQYWLIRERPIVAAADFKPEADEQETEQLDDEPEAEQLDDARVPELGGVVVDMREYQRRKAG